MALILNGKSWRDKDNFLPVQTVGILNGAFGEERVLTLDYSFDQSLDDCEIYFNPALFVEQGIVLEQTQFLPPDISYWYKVTAATVAGVENTMNLLSSNATERNMTVTFELNADRLSFKIRLTCFLTADILKFLSDDGIDNSIRLLGNTKNANELENLEDSVYNNSTTKGIGVHTGIKIPSFSALCGTKGKSGKEGVQKDTYIADSETFILRVKPFGQKDKFEIFVNGVLTASSGTTANNNYGAEWGFDGNAGAGYPLGTHPAPPVIPATNYWYVGYSIPSRLSQLQADTGVIASIGNYQQFVWTTCSPGDVIVVRVAGADAGTLWEYEVYCPQSTTTIQSRYDYTDAWINSEFLFLNEGTMTEPVFELSRNSVLETEFATFADTDVTLQIDYTAPKTISNAKVWVIDADNTVQSLDFKKAYGYQPSNYFDVPVPANIGGNTWETNFVVDRTKLNAGGRYFIIAVYYDSANEYVASYISNSIFVTDVQFLTPTITGTIYNLFANLNSNYIEVSPLQRVCCEITLDKYAGFDTAYLGGNVQIGGETFTFIGNNNQGSFENTNRFIFSNSVGSLIIRFYLRTKEEWQNTEVDIIWDINFNVEYTSVTFAQRLAISQMEQNKSVPNLIEVKLYKDGIELLEDGDTACDANFLRVETIKDASAVNYAQAAIWKDENGNVYEEEAWSPISAFAQSSNAFQSDVEIQFDTVLPDNDVNHNITNQVTTGEVGMIGYPPPLPLNFIRHPFHNTIYTGRNTVFETEYNYGAGKSIATVNGIPNTDFLFRIGSPTTSTDANSNDWAVFSDLSFAAFAAATITAGSRVMVRYVGASTQINIVGYIEIGIDSTPVNPKTIPLTTLKEICSGGLMFFTGQNIGFTNVTGAGIVFSKNRNFSEISANADLLTYENNLNGVPTPNISLVPHFFFQKTQNAANNINISVNNLSSVNIEIGNSATALSNQYYSATNNGVNPDAIQLDRINDNASATSALANAFMNIWELPIGTERTVVIRQKSGATGNGLNIAFSIGGGSFGDRISYVSGGGGGRRFQAILSSKAVGTVTTYVWRFTKAANFGDGGLIGDNIEVWVDDQKVNPTFYLNNMVSTSSVYSDLIGTNVATSSQFTSPSAIEFAAFFDGHLTLEEIEKVVLGTKNETFDLLPDYAWDFSRKTPLGKIPSVGVLPAPDLTIQGGAIISKLFE